MRTLALIYLLTALSLFGQPANLFPGAAYVATKTAASGPTAWILGMDTSSPNSSANVTLGQEITANVNCTITALGWYCGTGYTGDSLSLGVWSSTGTLLGSVSIAAGTMIVGQYNYVSLSTPISITSGSVYYIGACVYQAHWWYSSSDLTCAAAFTLDGYCYGVSDLLIWPQNTPGFHDYIGMNFQYTIP